MCTNRTSIKDGKSSYFTSFLCCCYLDSLVSGRMIWLAEVLSGRHYALYPDMFHRCCPLSVIIGEVCCSSSHWGDLIWQRMNHQGFSITCLCVLFIWCFLGEIYVLLSFGTYLSHALVKSQVDKFQTRLWLRFTREDSIFVIFPRSDPSSQISSDFQSVLARSWLSRGYGPTRLV